MDFDIDLQTSAQHRGAFRATIPGLSIRLPSGETCTAKDLSVGGAGFVPPPSLHLHKDQVLMLDILVADHLYVQGLESVVARVSPEAVACAFQNLTRTQEIRLDKLVLETQKRLIARRKAEEALKNNTLARRKDEEALKSKVQDDGSETGPADPIKLDM